MNKQGIKEKQTRYSLGILLMVLAINAFGGGYYGISGAEHVPVEWLRGSPFNSYLIPGLLLFIVIGGWALLAAIFVWRRDTRARKLAFGCGIILMAWLVIQVSIIGYVSWMQPATALAGILILFLSRQLPQYDQ